MVELLAMFNQMVSKYNTLSGEVKKNNAYLSNYISGISIESVDDIIKVLEKWLGDKSYNLAKDLPRVKLFMPLLRSSITSAIANIDHLINGNYGEANWRNLFMSIAPLVSVLHTVVIFDPSRFKNPLHEALSEASILLSNLDLVDEKLKQIDEKIEVINNISIDVEAYKAKVSEASEKIQEISTLAAANEVKFNKIVEDVKSKSEVILESYSTISEQLKLAKDNNKKIEKNIIILSQQSDSVKEIDGKLREFYPVAGTLSLELGFGDKAKSAWWSKLVWGFTFVVSILLTSLLVIFLFSLELGINKLFPDLPLFGSLVDKKENFQMFYILRLSAVAPFVWAAWFSAIQYGNNLRMKADYDYKASLCRAFIGFSQGGEKFFNLSEEFRKSATQQITDSFIKNIAENPLRLISIRSNNDASILSNIFKRRGTVHETNEGNK